MLKHPTLHREIDDRFEAIKHSFKSLQSVIECLNIADYRIQEYLDDIDGYVTAIKNDNDRLKALIELTWEK